VLRFIMDARVIGVRKHAVLRTAMPAHDAAVRHCLSTVMPRACRGLSSFRDGPKGRGIQMPGTACVSGFRVRSLPLAPRNDRYKRLRVPLVTSPRGSNLGKTGDSG